MDLFVTLSTDRLFVRKTRCRVSKVVSINLLTKIVASIGGVEGVREAARQVVSSRACSPLYPDFEKSGFLNMISGFSKLKKVILPNNEGVQQTN